jgi:hypothetical protein
MNAISAEAKTARPAITAPPAPNAALWPSTRSHPAFAIPSSRRQVWKDCEPITWEEAAFLDLRAMASSG